MTNKHPHAEMIKAKADNMDLVVFCKDSIGDWFEHGRNGVYCPFCVEECYFLCLPKHKDACLHWLNDGEVQVMDNNWVNMHPIEDYQWEEDHDFMDIESRIRIKPSKETRHVVIHNGRLVGELFKFDSDIRASYGAEYHDLQTFKIEIEV